MSGSGATIFGLFAEEAQAAAAAEILRNRSDWRIIIDKTVTRFSRLKVYDYWGVAKR